MTPFETYAQTNLKIQSKHQGLTPLLLNCAQAYIHAQLEAQKQRTGKVRAIILKGRQQGCSTYIAARFYHYVTTHQGVRVFIITHSQDATNNLFSMVERFCDHVPDAIKQPTRIASAKEKYFHELESGYRVGTAGTKGVGRSQTIHYLHASEVAFWPHAQTHFAGIMQAVPDLPGTEIILESTACGVGNRFHQLWQEAQSKDSEYIPIFVPWYWQEEYQKTPPDDWQPNETLKEAALLYHLSDAQLYWRYCKQKELGSEALFCQEYPSNASEAFHLADPTRFIASSLILNAQHTNLEAIHDTYAPRIGGCDPARFGNDQTAFCIRQGRAVIHLQTYDKQDTMQVAGLCIRYLQDYQLDHLCIDVVGLGAGVYDRLKELGYGHKISAINAAQKADQQEERYANKRAQMWDAVKQWLQCEALPVHLPQSDQLHADLSQPGYSFDSGGRLLIESKEAMRGRGLHSPDRADALALTFAVPFALQRHVHACHHGGWGDASRQHYVLTDDYVPFS